MWPEVTRHLRLDIDFSQIPDGLRKSLSLVPECGWLAKLHLTLEWLDDLREVEVEIGCDEAGRPIPRLSIEVLNQLVVFEDGRTDIAPPSQLIVLADRKRRELLNLPAEQDANRCLHSNRLRTINYRRDKALLEAKLEQIEKLSSTLRKREKSRAETRVDQRKIRDELLRLEIEAGQVKNTISDLHSDHVIGLESPVKRKTASQKSWHVEYVAFEVQRFSKRELFDHPIRFEEGMYDRPYKTASTEEKELEDSLLIPQYDFGEEREEKCSQNIDQMTSESFSLRRNGSTPSTVPLASVQNGTVSFGQPSTISEQISKLTLSRTDFGNFLDCPKAFWLSKRKPEAFPRSVLDVHSQLQAHQGYEFEAIARKVLERRLGEGVSFQTTMKAPEGLLSRADGLFVYPNVGVDIYKIKSGSGASKDYLADLAFQIVVAQRGGHTVRSAFLVHANKEYVLGDTLDPEGLIVISDQTVAARAFAIELEPQIDEALVLLGREQIDESQCSCLRKTRSSHCDAFAYISKPSIYTLPRISRARVESFVDAGIFNLSDIHEGDLDTQSQVKMLASYQAQAPLIDRAGIAEWIGKLTYPLCFFDYEAFASSVPIIKGTKPWEQVATQYSLHVLHENGQLDHFEHLTERAELPDALSKQLKQDLPVTGSVISWNMSYENTTSRRIGKWLPEHRDFFEDMIARTKDLMFLFVGDKSYPEGSYIDWRFMESASIKKVLPVMVPELSYDHLKINNGSAAIAAWRKLVQMPLDDRRASLRLEMLDYCHVNTLAMVKIFQKLETLC